MTAMLQDIVHSLSIRMNNRCLQPLSFVMVRFFLSSNWIEYFDMPNLISGMRKVRVEFRKHHNMTKNGRFAVLDVGDTKKTIKSEHDTELLIEDLQDEDYPSHASINFSPEDNLVIPIILSEMVKPCDMYSGTNEA